MVIDDENDCDFQIDIPDGMDNTDAKAAIKILYGADQSYRSVLRDFANYERKTSCDETPLGLISKSRKTRKRRFGRITHLHVTGISSIFLPSWDLRFEDVLKLTCLRSLKLDGCHRVCLQHNRPS